MNLNTVIQKSKSERKFNKFLLLFLLITANSFGQKLYNLGQYQMDPENKTISVLTGFHENDGDLHSWGERYVRDSLVDFDKAVIYVLGNQIILKEHLQQRWDLPEHLDLNSFKIIKNDIENYTICRDNNFLYRNSMSSSNNSKWESIDLSGFQTLNDFIYQKDGLLYFLSKDFKLKEIKGVKLHIPSLKHIMGNYFSDKKGLYLLGGYTSLKYNEENEQMEYFYSNESLLLQKSKNKKSVPEIFDGYFIYQKKVYAPSNFDENLPLPLNPEKLNQLVIKKSNSIHNNIALLADDGHLLVWTNNGFVPLESRYPDIDFLKNDFFQKDVNQWQLINQNICYNPGEKTGFFPSAIRKPKNYIGILIKKQNDFYAFSFNKYDSLKKIERVFIFDFDKQEYEPIDLTKYRYLAENLWIYKNRLYFTNLGLPTKETVETENLDFMEQNHQKTNYLKNGQSIIYVGNMGGYSTNGEGGKKMQVLGNRIFSEVDFPSLKVVTADILMDKNNIYTGDFQGINVVPIKDLGIEVKVFLEEKE